MKSLAVVAVIAAMGAVVGLAATSRARAAKTGPDNAVAAPRAEGERYAMSLGRPVELTEGERTQIETLIPGFDPNLIPPAKVGKIRGVLYGSESDATKRSLIKSLLD